MCICAEGLVSFFCSTGGGILFFPTPLVRRWCSLLTFFLVGGRGLSWWRPKCWWMNG
ncbi:hypothetical protein BDQ94DRAFT_144947 [Aspergillus welwitschiae]|uniref:Uncharacterized protein n=1 Tax=Aspergillus welwitschiae TaxID=1341132 RepID=A0A3F3Q0I4_9EURO|nr:hypothetical protein BDQ94DRAFT_144947 [Aspergillus welwitschiae]RDH32744.1 hypothetical protein BDQ94DRAFT_144947 [Aspergillus welwitschiae]